MTWHAVLRSWELCEGEIRGVTAGAVRIVLINVEGQIKAFKDECPHQGESLSRADFDGWTIVCARHRWEFDACTGCGISPGGSRLVEYEVRMEGGFVVVSDQPLRAQMARLQH